MALAQEDIDYIKEHIEEWVVEAILGKPLAVYNQELEERRIRVEKELKELRERMQQGFEKMEKRFEQFEKRFELIDI